MTRRRGCRRVEPVSSWLHVCTGRCGHPHYHQLRGRKWWRCDLCEGVWMARHQTTMRLRAAHTRMLDLLYGDPT